MLTKDLKSEPPQDHKNTNTDKPMSHEKIHLINTTAYCSQQIRSILIRAEQRNKGSITATEIVLLAFIDIV